MSPVARLPDDDETESPTPPWHGLAGWQDWRCRERWRVEHWQEGGRRRWRFASCKVEKYLHSSAVASWMVTIVAGASSDLASMD
jgi:hypothetical protein